MADRPSVVQRVLGALVPRTDAPPAPIAGPPARRGFIGRRVDAIRNTFLGIGDDKVQAGRPDLWRIPLSYEELTALWRYGGHARRFVEVVPADATKKGWAVKAGEDVVGEVEDEHKRLNVFSHVNEADSWGRLYGAGYLLMVTADDKTGTRWETNEHGWTAQPLDLRRVRRVDNLVPLDKYECQPVAYERDMGSPLFGRPIRYRVNANIGGGYGGGLEVHASRLLYFRGNMLPRQARMWNDGVDDSILQSVWDQIRNANTLSHSLAALAAEMRISVVQMRNLADMSVSDEAEYFDLRMKLMAQHKSILNMVLLGEGETYDHKQGTVAGMAELSETTRQDLQAVTGMPEQLWIGSAPGGLNTDGESHRQLWASVISSYQTVKLDPILVQLYQVLFAAKEGPWRGLAPAKWKIEFNPLDELTETGRANLRKTVADTDAVYIDRGVLDPARVTEARYGEKGWQMDIAPPDVAAAPSAVGLNMAAIEQELEAGGAAPAGAAVDVAKQAMNGAQAKSLQELIAAATRREIPVGTLGPQIRSAFQQLVSPEDLREIVAEVRAALGEPEPQRDPVTGQPVPVPADTEDDETEPQLTPAEELAQHLTELQLTRCEHGSVNRCRLCGIERKRSVKLGPNGAPELDAEGNPVWAVAWVPMARGDRHASVGVRPAPPAPSRRDADDLVSIWVGLPLPEDARPAWNAARLEAATVAGVTVDELDLRGHEPHVTLFWVGKVPAAEAQARSAAVKAVLDELLENHRAIELQGTGLGAFGPSPSSEGDTPMYVGIAGAALYNLNEALADKLLDEDERKSRPWFCAHAAVGYYAGELTGEQWSKIWQARVGRGTWSAEVIELHVGGGVAGRWTLATR